MFAIAFDLVVKEVTKHHPSQTASHAYNDVKTTLKKYGFDWVQGSLYVSRNEDMTQLFQAITALKNLSWFSQSVRDIRSFRVEQWSDFTEIVKS